MRRVIERCAQRATSCRAPRTRMAALTANLLILLICTACSHQLSRSEFERQQHDLDELAQITIASISLSLDAEPPSDNVWGQGHAQACKYESDKVGYVIDTLVTYYGIDNRRASSLIKETMKQRGITVRNTGENGVVRGNKDPFTVDATPTGTATNPAGMSISFATGCLTVGQELASELANEPPREVRVISGKG